MDFNVSPLVPEWEEEGIPEDDNAEPDDADVDHQGEVEVEDEG